MGTLEESEPGHRREPGAPADVRSQRMRFATVEGRITLSTPDRYADVTAASRGRFGPDRGRALDDPDRFAAELRSHLNEMPARHE
jgi:hypothetical protein